MSMRTVTAMVAWVGAAYGLGCSDDGLSSDQARRAEVTACLTVGDCPGDTLCHRGVCVVESCEETGNCAEGLVCEDRRCQPRGDGRCTREEDCELHLTCTVGGDGLNQCLPVPCEQDLDCRGRDARCNTQTLTCEPDNRPRCVTDRDCPWDTASRCNRLLRRCELKEDEGACAGDIWCEQGQRCDRETRNCIDPEACRYDLDCRIDHRCVETRCRAHQLGDACRYDSDCPDEGMCTEQQCIVR